MGGRERRITELSNPRTEGIDRLAPDEIVQRILAEDALVPAAVAEARDQITEASNILFEALAAGGRWFNLGAGTSGRIGVLDAAEIPPTFGLEADRVQGVIAGGGPALERAVEGAEDDSEAAPRDLRRRGFGPGDVLVALSASGRTPYALAAVEHAREIGASSIAITCAPEAPLASTVDLPIVLLVGPEVIAGSTRLKGGLVQKMVLHTLSTAVMIRLGRVRGNLMTGLRPGNQKLRERAVDIVAELAGCTIDEARAALERTDGSVERALESLTP